MSESNGGKPKWNGTKWSGPKRDVVTAVVKEVLGGGEGVGSKASFFGIILTALWMMFEYHNSNSQTEFERLYQEVVDAKNKVSEHADERRERLYVELQHTDTELYRELANIRKQIEQGAKDCEKLFHAIKQAIQLKE